MKLTYHRCGDYLLPDLTIPDEPVALGKYGRMRKTYLKEHKPILYNALLLSKRYRFIRNGQGGKQVIAAAVIGRFHTNLLSNTKKQLWT